LQSHLSTALFILTGASLGQQAIAQHEPQVGETDIQLLRSDVRSERKQIIAENLRLTDTEAEKFLPVHDAHTQENDTLTDAQADDLAKRMAALEVRAATSRRQWIPRFRKVHVASDFVIHEWISRPLLRRVALGAVRCERDDCVVASPRSRSIARLQGHTGNHLRKVTGVKKYILVAAFLVLLAVLAHAKSTKLVASWKNPQYPTPKFHRVLVLGMSANPRVRADFEDALSQLVTRDGVEAVPGNTILLRPEGAQLNLDYLKTQIREFEIDAVIVSRLVKVNKTVTYVPGQPYFMPYPYYGSFYGYYSAIYPVVYSPDYLREDTTVRVWKRTFTP